MVKKRKANVKKWVVEMLKRNEEYTDCPCSLNYLLGLSENECPCSSKCPIKDECDPKGGGDDFLSNALYRYAIRTYPDLPEVNKLIQRLVKERS